MSPKMFAHFWQLHDFDVVQALIEVAGFDEEEIDLSIHVVEMCVHFFAERIYLFTQSSLHDSHVIEKDAWSNAIVP